MSIFDGPDYDNSVALAGDGKGEPYINWDKDSVTVCQCDASFFGPDCSLVMCPKGDDPLTLDQNNLVIQLTIDNSQWSEWYGTIGIKFMGETTVLQLPILTSKSCTMAFQTSSQIGTQMKCECEQNVTRRLYYILLLLKVSLSACRLHCVGIPPIYDDTNTD